MSIELIDQLLKTSFSSSHNELSQKNGSIRDEYSRIFEYINSQSPEKLISVKKKIDFVLKEKGVTFGENHEGKFKERPWYLDIIPIIITNNEFSYLEKSLKQRLTALNLFIKDIYT